MTGFFKKTSAFGAAAVMGLLGLGGCAAGVTNNDIGEVRAAAPLATGSPALATKATAQELLRPYYARLAGETDLPTMRSPALNTAAPLTRIAFGSCNHHGRSQDIWQSIAATKSGVFLAIGDNVYGDTGYRGDADLGSFQAAYRQQAAYPEFQAFMVAQPVLATWDDHDFGTNDSGGSFFAKEWSETLFENFWNSSAEVRARPGVYDSVAVGPVGQRVQIIILDTRFFRSDLTEKPYSEERYPLGSYLPNSNPSAQVLGDAQWRWLEVELAKPADLRIVVSSIQVLTDAHDFESWENFPIQREKLYQMLAGRTASGIVLLSGDRHSGGVYTDTPAALGEQVWELTSSSLNLAFVSADASEREPDARRTTQMVTEENFGLVDVDWAKREMVLRLMDDTGGEILSQRVGF